MKQSKSKDFNIYYLSFTKVYEIAMMINNVILSKIEKNHTKSFEEQYGFTSSISAQGSKFFLNGIKASISTDSKETAFSSSRVVETLDVKTTKSILLRRVIEQCMKISSFGNSSEGDLIKIDHVKLEILDEESLRRFLIIRRDALKGMKVEGMEVNNIVSSMLQDYAYILKGRVHNDFTNSYCSEEILIKIPLEIQTEFENKYSIDDLLIGHVSIIGVYKGLIEKESVSSNTFTFFQDIGEGKTKEKTTKIIKSNEPPLVSMSKTINTDKYHFVYTLAIIQNVSFNLEESETVIPHWWNKLGIWLSSLWRK